MLSWRLPAVRGRCLREGVKVSYPVLVEDAQVDGFLARFAPDDVRDTIAWLSENGYLLSSHRGDSTFGAQFVYSGKTTVFITVDRSQWMLDVARGTEAPPWQYDLLIAAKSGESYERMFPVAGARSVGDSQPRQLPDGVTWRETLPGVLEWIEEEDVPETVDRALDQRFYLMFGRRRRHRGQRRKVDHDG